MLSLLVTKGALAGPICGNGGPHDLKCDLNIHEDLCRLDAQDISVNLNLDYQAFDQTTGDGWRKWADRACDIQGAILVDAYHLHNLSILLPWQDHALYWHAGQLYANDKNYQLAISRFNKSLNSDELPNDPFKWNAYVKASIAFLENNKVELRKQRDELRNATDPGSQNNLTIVNRMIDCFGQPYKEVLSNFCHPQ